MRTCLKTAGKGNSTYCLQTWTHMSENAQNIAFFTRSVGAESAGLSIFYVPQYMESSSQLTNSYFSEEWLNHQPYIYIWDNPSGYKTPRSLHSPAFHIGARRDKHRSSRASAPSDWAPEIVLGKTRVIKYG